MSARAVRPARPAHAFFILFDGSFETTRRNNNIIIIIIIIINFIDPGLSVLE